MDHKARAQTLRDDLIELRRALHRHPELAFDERQTAARVSEELRSIGLEPREGVGGTGVVTDIGDGDGPLVALRADMDALPIREETGLPFASEVDGVMHACGHDAHTAALVGAARMLHADAEDGRLSDGRVRLLFQPAEESTGPEGASGAPLMVRDGAMAGVSAVVGLHLWAHRPVGELRLSEGPVMAGADELRIHILGRAAHASRPEEGIDAIALAAQGISAAQLAVSRRIPARSPGVVTFGTIRGGNARNAVAGRVDIEGTLRFFDDDTAERLRESVHGAFQMLESLGARVRIEFGPTYPPVANDPAVTRIVREGLATLFGVTPGEAEPVLAAEDFSWLAREAPGCFLWVGAAPPSGPREHHRPDFDIDEGAIPVAAASYACAASSLLAAAAGDG